MFLHPPVSLVIYLPTNCSLQLFNRFLYKIMEVKYCSQWFEQEFYRKAHGKGDLGFQAVLLHAPVIIIILSDQVSSTPNTLPLGIFLFSKVSVAEK